MIVNPAGDKLLLIRQPDHAVLSGELARNWGNAFFHLPEPFDALVRAATRHDNGWEEWEQQPKVNPATGRPYQFTEMPVEEHLTFYVRGVERAVAEDRYSGLLVNMHCAGLYNQRYGIDPSLPMKHYDAEKQRVIRGFLDRLEEQQKRLRQELDESGIPPPFAREAHIWMNYKLLQIHDRLSLYLCMPPLRERTLGPAPVDESEEVELMLRPEGEKAVQITPYPFRVNPLRVGVVAREVPDRHYENDETLREMLAQAAPLALRYELHA